MIARGDEFVGQSRMPETSIHPDLIEPLAPLFANAAIESQILVTTHSRRLAEMIQSLTDANVVFLDKIRGETHIVAGELNRGE